MPQLIDIAGQVRAVETRTTDAEARLRPLDGREQQIRDLLDLRRTEIVEVLAALQRAGRRTPPALLICPEDALQSLRTAMLLGAVVPELRVRAEKLTSDLSELVTLRKTIAAERDKLAVDRDRLKDDQIRLAALVDERQRKQSAIERDMEAEGARAVALSKQADNLQGLIAKMELDLKSAAKAAAAASLQGTPTAPNGKPNWGHLKDPARLSPAVAFASAKALFAYPVNGTKICDFGGSDGAGGVEKGISLATRAGAQVTTPCDGWVVYAGPFRSYGQLLILNAGVQVVPWRSASMSAATKTCPSCRSHLVHLTGDVSDGADGPRTRCRSAARTSRRDASSRLRYPSSVRPLRERSRSRRLSFSISLPSLTLICLRVCPERSCWIA